MKHFLIFPILLAVFLLANVSEAGQAINVKVQKAQEGTIDNTREYIGTVEAIQRVVIKPELSAKISKLHFSEGSFVKSGATLFTLDSSQFSANVALRKAQLARAQAALDRAQRYMKRLKAADKRSVPASDIDTAEDDIRQAQASVAEAKANLQLAQIDLNRTRITAPISGVIGRAGFTKGNYVSPSSELAVIIQMNPIRVLFSVSEADYSSWLKNSYTASLTLADGSAYDASNTGRMDFSDNTVNTSTGTIAIRWSFDNDNSTLLPGSTVRITLTPLQEQRAVMIPQASVLADIDGSYVYVVEGDTAHVRRVKSLGVSSGKTAVDGVRAGELVVEGGTQMLSDGAKVKIQDK
ncbi:MAG: efflux RND transporter periplasmic adaptor subunit [Synergistaceae bacterium]|nr:efflux RND transporter periplasmic adaptor subunit [Synergistaceae bacterium]